MTKHVFVYGTLKQGYWNHGVLGSAKFIGRGSTVSAGYKMLDGGFPMVLPDGLFKIRGEVYAVDDDRTMANLDRLEGVPTLFNRHHVDITLDGSQDVLPSVMYIGHPRFQKQTNVNYITPNENNECEWR